MLGKMIEDKLIERRISRTEFSKRIKRSRSYVYNLLEKGSVETGDLLTISKILGYNFFAHLNDKVKHLPPYEEEVSSEDNIKTSQEERLMFLEKENADLLRRVVELLEEKVKREK